MLYRSKENPNSHLTVKDRKSPSLPIKALWERNLVKGKMLDFGSGLGRDIQFLKEKGFDTIGYDPHYAPEYPGEKFDTIVCNYVLNVLLPIEQSHVLMAVAELLKPGGSAYFAVRRDIKKNGFLYNPKRRAKTYQCNVVLPYKSVFRTEYCEIYAYQHYTDLHAGNKEVCPFFGNGDKLELITESATAFSIYAPSKNDKTQALIFPKRKTPNYFELSIHEQQACWLMLNRVREIILREHAPEGFEVRMKTVNHSQKSKGHVHISLKAGNFG